MDNLDMARAALRRLLDRDVSLRGDRRFHLDYIDGYVKALDDAATGDPARLKADPGVSHGFWRGYRDALADIGLND